MTSSRRGAVIEPVEIVWELRIHAQCWGTRSLRFRPLTMPGFQPTPSQHSANEPHLVPKRRNAAIAAKWPLCSLKKSGCQPVTEAHWPQSCLKIMVSPVQIRVPPPRIRCVTQDCMSGQLWSEPFPANIQPTRDVFPMMYSHEQRGDQRGRNVLGCPESWPKYGLPEGAAPTYLSSLSRSLVARRSNRSGSKFSPTQVRYSSCSGSVGSESTSRRVS